MTDKITITVTIIIILFASMVGYLIGQENPEPKFKSITCIDGDTIQLGDEYIRLAYIDTPEKGEYNYNQASLFTCNWLNNNEFEIDRLGVGKYGRTLANVRLRGSKHPLDSLSTVLMSKCLAKPFYTNTTPEIIKLNNKCYE